MGKTYYKVVSERNGELKSAIFNSAPPTVQEILLTYTLNDWVYPQIDGSKIMVFDNIKDAVDFRTEFGDAVFKCKVKNPQRKGPFISSVFNPNLKNILQKLIKIKRQKKRYFGIKQSKVDPNLTAGQTSPCYRNTIFCDTIMLLERVDNV